MRVRECSFSAKTAAIILSPEITRGTIAFLEHDLLRKDRSHLRVLCFGKRYFDSALKAFRSEIVITECKKP